MNFAPSRLSARSSILPIQNHLKHLRADVKSLRILSKRIDQFSLWTGKTVAWLTLIMVLVQLLIVLMRYVFSMGSIALQESVWYMHGIIFMVAAGATYLADEHVRIDVFYDAASKKFRAWVNLLGIVFFVFPLSFAMVYLSWGYVLNAWAIREGSIELTGLPYIYLLKTVIWVFAFVLALQGVSQLIKALDTLFSNEDAEARR